MRTFHFLSFGLLVIGLVVVSCKKDKDTVVNIRLTDGPGDYQQVNIDIREIVLKTTEDTAKWVTLATNAGVYDLLKFQNGVDTLLATGPAPAFTLKEVRFILGPNSTVMVDSIIYPLETPSAESSGLKVKIDKDLNLDINTFVLDFDAQASIEKKGNGDYKLKPTIKLK